MEEAGVAAVVSCKTGGAYVAANSCAEPWPTRSTR